MEISPPDQSDSHASQFAHPHTSTGDLLLNKESSWWMDTLAETGRFGRLAPLLLDLLHLSLPTGLVKDLLRRVGFFSHRPRGTHLARVRSRDRGGVAGW